jgi:hypothetical protein
MVWRRQFLRAMSGGLAAMALRASSDAAKAAATRSGSPRFWSVAATAPIGPRCSIATPTAPARSSPRRSTPCCTSRPTGSRIGPTMTCTTNIRPDGLARQIRRVRREMTEPRFPVVQKGVSRPMNSDPDGRTSSMQGQFRLAAILAIPASAHSSS